MNPLFLPPSCLLHALMWPLMIGSFLHPSLISAFSSFRLSRLSSFALRGSVPASSRCLLFWARCALCLSSAAFSVPFASRLYSAPSSASCFCPVLHAAFYFHTFLIQFQKPQYFPCAKLCRSDTCRVSTGRFALTNGVATEIFLFLLAHKKSISVTILGAALCLRHCFGNVKLIVQLLKLENYEECSQFIGDFRFRSSRC